MVEISSDQKEISLAEIFVIFYTENYVVDLYLLRAGFACNRDETGLVGNSG